MSSNSPHGDQSSVSSQNYTTIVISNQIACHRCCHLAVAIAYSPLPPRHRHENIHHPQSVLAQGDPARDQDRAYLGHFANDGATLTSDDSAARQAYVRDTEARSNAAFAVVEGSHMCTVATRDIACGAEVLLTYGEGYWLGRIESATEMGKEEGKGKGAKGSKAKGSEGTRPPANGFG